MQTSVKRVKTKKEFDTAVEDAEIEGWSLESQGSNVAVFKKNGGYGSLVGHLLVFLLTGWWTLMIGNFVYGMVSHMGSSKELRIKF